MADFYGTVAEFKTYFAARAVDVSAYADPAITAALVVASEWLDASFRDSFDGLKVGLRAQIREWPRTGASDIYGYYINSSVPPQEMIEATYQTALRQLASPGSLSVDFTPAKYQSVSVDGAVSVTYANFHFAADIQTQFPIVAQILAPILTRYGGQTSMYSGRVHRV